MHDCYTRNSAAGQISSTLINSIGVFQFVVPQITFCNAEVLFSSVFIFTIHNYMLTLYLYQCTCLCVSQEM